MAPLRANVERWSDVRASGWVAHDSLWGYGGPLDEAEERDLFGNFRCKFRMADELATIPEIELASRQQVGAVVGLGTPGDTASGLFNILTSTGLRRFVGGEQPLGVEQNVFLEVESLRALQSLGLAVGQRSSTDDLARRIAGWAADLNLPSAKQELLRGYERYAGRGWDGDDAEPLTATTLAYARSIMDDLPDNFGLPDASPGLDGSIALEWYPEGHRKLHKLFLDIGPDRRWRAYWKLKNGAFDRLLGEGTDVRPILQSLFDKLS